MTLLTAAAAAKRLDVSIQRIYQLAREGKLAIAKEEPYGKTRVRRWFRAGDVDALLPPPDDTVNAPV